jgi:hypothetical protein
VYTKSEFAHPTYIEKLYTGRWQKSRIYACFQILRFFPKRNMCFSPLFGNARFRKEKVLSSESAPFQESE